MNVRSCVVSTISALSISGRATLPGGRHAQNEMKSSMPHRYLEWSPFDVCRYLFSYRSITDKAYCKRNHARYLRCINQAVSVIHRWYCKLKESQEQLHSQSRMVRGKALPCRVWPARVNPCAFQLSQYQTSTSMR